MSLPSDTEALFHLPPARWLLLFGILAFSISLGFGTVHAAPLDFATSENPFLTSPATTLTIATGSVADALTITSSSILVTR